MARPEKVAAVEEISGRLRNSEAALLTEYRGLRVGDIAEVRSALREAGAEYKVFKNTLARLAVKEVGLDELLEMLTGPTAIAFIGGDAAAAAKALDEATKKFPVLVMKGGVLAGKVISADQARELARLEPREVQLSKIAMLFNAPAQNTVNVLSALLRNLGSMLAQVIEQKQTVAAAEAPTAAAVGDGAVAATEESGIDDTPTEAALGGDTPTEAAPGGQETPTEAAPGGQDKEE